MRLNGQLKAMRRRLPETRKSITHKFNVAGHKGYVNVGLYEDGTPGELFITMGKDGSTIGGLMESLSIAVSVGLQHGVPLAVFCKHFIGQHYEPSGTTTDPDLPLAMSLTDHIFSWLLNEFYGKAKTQRNWPDLSCLARAGDESETATTDPSVVEGLS